MISGIDLKRFGKWIRLSGPKLKELFLFQEDIEPKKRKNLRTPSELALAVIQVLLLMVMTRLKSSSAVGRKGIKAV